MKNLLFVFAFSILAISCSDPCDDVNCGPGTCDNGTCMCPDGFSGVNCEIEDLCFNVDCGNGTCNEDTGTCDCDEGYEGDNCESEIRAPFIGRWVAVEWACDGEMDDLILNFTKNEDNILQVNIFDDIDPDIIIIADVFGDNLVINEQTVIDEDGDELTFSGDVSINNEVLSLSINLEVQGLLFQCFGTFVME